MISHIEGVSFLHMLRQYYTTMPYIIHKKNRVHCECVGLLSTEKGQCWQGLENEGKKHQLRKTRGHEITTEEPRYNRSISHENTFVIQ